MSGHSKWSTIKRKKEALDVQRSRMFSKLLREITIAVNLGGPDMASNSRLRLAVQNAKGVSMPKDNIEKAISRGTKDTSSYTSITYEATWMHGVAMIIECTTDNTNRTVSDIRSILGRNGGFLQRSGAVAYMFNRKCFFDVLQSNIDDYEQILFDLIEYGGDNSEIIDGEDNEGNMVEFTGNVDSFSKIQGYFECKNIDVKKSGLKYISNIHVELDDETLEKALDLVDLIDSMDDVQNVYHNIQ